MKTTEYNPSFSLFLVTVVLSCFIGDVYGFEKDIKFKQLSIIDGLSQNTPLCILQDRIGFIWIGTQGGLNRYDGYNFRAYTHDVDNPNSLSCNVVNSLCENSATGHIFMGTEVGLNEFDPEKQQCTRFLHEPDNPNSLSNNRVFSVCDDNRGSIWIGTENGLNRYRIKEKLFFRYTTIFPKTTDSLVFTVIKYVYADKTGMIWLCTVGNGLVMYDPVKKTFIQYRYSPGKKNCISSNYILSIVEDHNGVLWIGTDGGGLNRFERSTGKFTVYKINSDNTLKESENIINTIIEDIEGYLWLGKENDGLVVFNPEKGESFFYKNVPTIPYSISSNKIKTIFQDESGNIWISHLAAGINIAVKEKNQFELYQQDPYNSNSLSDNNVWQIFEDKNGIVWIGTQTGGLNRFDRKINQWKHYMYNPDNPNGIDNNRVARISQSNDGTLWVCTFGGGLAKYDSINESFKFYKLGKNDPLNPDENRVTAIYYDRKGQMWIGTKGGGMKCFDPRTEKITHYMHDPTNPLSLNNNRVYCFHEDSDGILWAGLFGGGLDRFDRDKNQFTHFMSDSANPHSISSNFIMNIYEDKNGTMWIATYGGGINKFDRSSGLFQRFTEKDGLCNNDAYAIFEDRKDNLWISTNKGISKFNKKLNTFENFTIYDGLQSDEFNHGASFQNKKGEIYFGGVSGFNIFNPDSVNAMILKSPIVITGFEIFNKPVGVDEKILGKTILHKSITHTREITLTYKHNVFSIQYAALNYTYQKRVYYAYIMEGLEKEWNYVGNRQFVTFSTLPPGKYTFKVKASNDNKTWSQKSNDLEIIILPPFWKTTWFYILVSIFVVSILVWVYRLQINKLEKKKKQEEQKRIIETFSMVLRKTRAAVYKRKIGSDIYEFMSDGVCDIIGYAPSEINFQLWSKILVNIENRGDLAGLSFEQAYQLINKGKVALLITDGQLRTKSGTVCWVMDMITILRDKSGNATDVLGIMFDITERKLAEKELAEKKKEMEKDLNMAREVQMALLSHNYPKYFPSNVPVERCAVVFNHRYIPASILAGDFFEIFPISEYEVGVLIYDIMGHGVRASLITAYFHGLLKELLPVATDPAAFMKQLNMNLFSLVEHFFTGFFATAFYTVVNVKTGVMNYCNAGHHSPYILRRGKGVVDIVGAGNTKHNRLIGICKEDEYKVYSDILSKNDVLFLYTDGLTDAMNEQGKLYGNEQLAALLQESLDKPPDILLNEIIADIQSFTNTSEFKDDVCLITMEVKNILTSEG